MVQRETKLAKDFSEKRCEEKRKEKKKPAIVELSSLKFDMPMSSLQLWPVEIRAASSSMG